MDPSVQIAVKEIIQAATLPQLMNEIPKYVSTSPSPRRVFPLPTVHMSCDINRLFDQLKGRSSSNLSSDSSLEEYYNWLRQQSLYSSTLYNYPNVPIHQPVPITAASSSAQQSNIGVPASSQRLSQSQQFPQPSARTEQMHAQLFPSSQRVSQQVDVQSSMNSQISNNNAHPSKNLQTFSTNSSSSSLSSSSLTLSNSGPTMGSVPDTPVGGLHSPLPVFNKESQAARVQTALVKAPSTKTNVPSSLVSKGKAEVQDSSSPDLGSATDFCSRAPLYPGAVQGQSSGHSDNKSSVKQLHSQQMSSASPAAFLNNKSVSQELTEMPGMNFAASKASGHQSIQLTQVVIQQALLRAKSLDPNQPLFGSFKKEPSASERCYYESSVDPNNYIMRVLPSDEQGVSAPFRTSNSNSGDASSVRSSIHMENPDGTPTTVLPYWYSRPTLQEVRRIIRQKSEPTLLIFRPVSASPHISERSFPALLTMILRRRLANSGSPSAVSPQVFEDIQFADLINSLLVQTADVPDSSSEDQILFRKLSTSYSTVFSSANESGKTVLRKLAQKVKDYLELPPSLRESLSMKEFHMLENFYKRIFRFSEEYEQLHAGNSAFHEID